ncbi:MAG: VOC family protein [Pseudomonadota bacterium]
MGNPVVHFEIISSNSDEAQQFYANLFGWSFNSDNPLQYGAADTGNGEGGLGGGIGQPYPGTDDTYVTFYIGVQNVADTLQQVIASGGSVAMPVIELPGGLKMAQFSDPFGARVGLLEIGG